MTGRPSFATVADLEAALADLGVALQVPPTPDLATAIGTRLRGEPTVVARARPGTRRLRRSLLLAAVISLLIVGTVLGIRFGLPSLGIEFRPPSPSTAPTGPPASGSPSAASTAPSPSARPTSLDFGEPTTLAAVTAAAPFAVRVPGALPPPDVVFDGGPRLRGQIAFLYDATADLPAAPLLSGSGLLVTQTLGNPDDGLAHKLADNGLATVTSVTVNETAGYWIAGQPHVFWYLAPDGSVVEDSRRLVGDTLVWERDGVLYRIEGAITLDRALEIAESMTPVEVPTP
jgi:hypothetical protein